MNSPDPSLEGAEYRRLWATIVPTLALCLLAFVGCTLSVMLRVHPDSGPGFRINAVLYMLSLVPMPVAIACLLAGFAWSRVAISMLLWIYLSVTLLGFWELINHGHVRQALVLGPFLLAQAAALRLVHGERIRSSVRRMEEKRVARWGVGFGLYLLACAAQQLAATTVMSVVAYELDVVGALAPLVPAGFVRTAVVGLGVVWATWAIVRMPRSLWPARSLLGISAIAAMGLMVLAARGVIIDSLVVCAAAVGLVCLSQRSVIDLCMRQRRRHER